MIAASGAAETPADLNVDHDSGDMSRIRGWRCGLVASSAGNDPDRGVAMTSPDTPAMVEVAGRF